MSKAPVNRHHHEAFSVRHRCLPALAGKHQATNSIFISILYQIKNYVNGRIKKLRAWKNQVK